MKCLLLDMAKERAVEPLLRLVVERLEALPRAALARVWLMGPGDICGADSKRKLAESVRVLVTGTEPGRDRRVAGRRWVGVT